MTVDQIHAVLNLPTRSVERFSYACAILGLTIERSSGTYFLIPTKGRGIDQQTSIAQVLQEAFHAIDDYAIMNDGTLRVWL